MARTPGGTLSAFTLLSTPDEPTITSITTSIGSASVAFTAPTDVGDAAVSSYVVTAVDESSGASTGATGSASPITVTPPAGGTFKIRMQALNAYGPGRLTEYDTGNVIYGGAELYVWGLNTTNGQLGDGTTINRSSPVQVGSLTTWSKGAVGESFTHAIKTDGTLWGWGRNNVGAVGDGTVVFKSSPVQIGALTTWYQVAASAIGSAAIKTDGTLWIWGGDSNGALGQNTENINKSSPVQIGALTTWYQVAAGDSHFGAIKTDGTLWMWGANSQGNLGQNNIIARSSPVQVGSLTNWSNITCGTNHSGAIKTDGTLWTWGRNHLGQLGDNTIISRSSPVQVGALTNWSQISSGRYHHVSIKTDGTTWTWGDNGAGELGDGTSINRSSPIQVGALTNWLSVARGCRASHCFVTLGVV